MKSFEVEEEGIPFRILWHEGLASLIQVGKKGLWHLVRSFLWQRKGRKQAIRTEERGLERIRYVEREPADQSRILQILVRLLVAFGTSLQWHEALVA